MDYWMENQYNAESFILSGKFMKCLLGTKQFLVARFTQIPAIEEAYILELCYLVW